MTIAGLITSLQLKRTKKGDLWAIATVEDLDGAIECLFFPSAYMTYSTMLAQDTVCAVKGTHQCPRRLDLDLRAGADDPRHQGGSAGAGRADPAARRGPPRPWPRASSACSVSIPGATEVQVKLTQPGRSVLMSLDDSLRVNATSALFGDLKALLGPACLSLSPAWTTTYAVRRGRS